MWLLCAAIVSIEALLVLAVVRMGQHMILGRDGQGYEQYAVNIVNHLAYSDSLRPPFFASVFRTPGYPLFLALLQWLAPGSLVSVRIAQFVILAITSALVYHVALAVASRAAAVFSAVACATFLPFVWLAAYHLTETLATLLTVTVVLLTFRTLSSDSGVRNLARPGLLGISIGLLTLVRPEDALIAIVVSAGLLLGSNHQSRLLRFRQAGVVVIGFVLVMAPWTIRNAVVTHHFLPLGANSGQTLYASQEQYAGRIGYGGTSQDYQRVASDIDAVTVRGPAATSPTQSVAANRRSALTGASAEIRLNDEIVAAARRGFATLSIGEVVRGLPARVEHLWGTGDYPPAGDLRSIAHRLAVAQWAFLIVLAAVGLVRVAVEHRVLKLWPLFMFPLYTTLVHLVFEAEARYSIPDRPFVFVFAGIGLAWLTRLLRHRDFRVGSKVLRLGSGREQLVR